MTPSLALQWQADQRLILQLHAILEALDLLEQAIEETRPGFDPERRLPP